MDKISTKFNEMLMQEVGLEIGPRRRIYDQDTGALIQIDGKDLVCPGSASGRTAQEFDPFNSNKMASQILSYYLDKLSNEGETDFNVFYSVEDGKGRGHIECKGEDGNVIKSGTFQRDSVKYADVIMKLNGDNSANLAEFDIPKERTTFSMKVPDDKRKEAKKK